MLILPEPSWRPSVQWVFQWPEWLRMFNYNWVNFYPLRLGIEAGKYKGRYVEVECVVLGVGFVFELYEVDSREHWGDDMDKLMEKHKASDTFFVLDDCGECHGTGSVFREETK